MGGEAGKKVLETLSHIVGRIESVWKPFTVTSGKQEFRFHFASEDKASYVRRDGVDFIFRINEGIYETVNTASASTLQAMENGNEDNSSQTS